MINHKAKLYRWIFEKFIKLKSRKKNEKNGKTYFWQHDSSKITNIALLQHFLQKKPQVLLRLPSLKDKFIHFNPKHIIFCHKIGILIIQQLNDCTLSLIIHNHNSSNLSRLSQKKENHRGKKNPPVVDLMQAAAGNSVVA